MYQKFGIKKEILDLSEEVEKEIQPIFKNIEKIEEINSLKVLSAFQECGLSEMHLHSSTGYGIDEIGDVPRLAFVIRLTPSEFTKSPIRKITYLFSLFICYFPLSLYVHSLSQTGSYKFYDKPP